jgi:hypothetical protein
MAYTLLEDENYKQKVRKRLLRKSVVNDITGCRIWTGSLTDGGYGRMHLKKQYVHVHRVVYEAFVDKIPDGKIVMHKCDNRACIEVSHLVIGTLIDNNKDRDMKGRTARQFGTTNGMAKFVDDDIVSIRSIIPSTSILNYKEIRDWVASEYNVCPGTIASIVKRKTWTHI